MAEEVKESDKHECERVFRRKKLQDGDSLEDVMPAHHKPCSFS